MSSAVGGAIQILVIVIVIDWIFSFRLFLLNCAYCRTLQQMDQVCSYE